MSNNLPARFAHASMSIDASLVVAHEIEEKRLEPTPGMVTLFSKRLAALEALLPELRGIEAQLRHRSTGTL